MTDIFIDFETRSRVDLIACGASRYAQDESTDVLCMAYAIDDGPVCIWKRGEPYPQILDSAIRGGYLFHAWYSGFERAIWQYVMVARRNWRAIPFENWRCTAAKAAHANHPRGLDRAAERLLPEKFRKDKEGRKAMLATCKPNKKGGWVEDEESLGQLYPYCQQDVLVERALDKVLPDWPESEVEVWQMNERINDRGVPIDRELCEGAASLLDTTLDGLAERISKMTNGEITTGDQIQRIKKFVAERGVNMKSLDKDHVAAELEHDLPADVRDILLLRQLTSGAAAKKFKSVLGIAEDDDCARGMFMYYAASTGRFGSGKTQYHNMKKGADKGTAFRNIVIEKDIELAELVYGNTIVSVLGRNVRSLVCAHEGNTLIRIDLSQIECRVLHWLAGNERMLALFRAGEDPYVKLAQKAFNKPVVKEGDPERDVGKAGELGLGFGMGHVRFIGQVKEQAGIDINERFARHVVIVWRKENPEVLKLWSGYEVAAKTCVETGRTVRYGKVVFKREGSYLTVTLPSGRQLFYYKPEFEQGKRGPRFIYWGPNGPRHEWAGGLLTENVVQAVARDILVYAMQRVQSLGWNIVMHVHDEMIVEASCGDITRPSDDMMDCMTVGPEWAKGLPLAAELKVVETYA